MIFQNKDDDNFTAAIDYGNQKHHINAGKINYSGEEMKKINKRRAKKKFSKQWSKK